eukprot:GHVU01115420.1.p2 GENE.GHVU01115420.1~~GHVU01115420.1.p2  ORF type:complete len:102 (+),score=2.23 GHVU01115420.1:188-493(+)
MAHITPPYPTTISIVRSLTDPLTGSHGLQAFASLDSRKQTTFEWQRGHSSPSFQSVSVWVEVVSDTNDHSALCADGTRPSAGHSPALSCSKFRRQTRWQLP